jgi:hypothetical protein
MLIIIFMSLQKIHILMHSSHFPLCSGFGFEIRDVNYEEIEAIM